MANKHVKGSSRSLATSKMQSKIMMLYYCISIKLAKIKKKCDNIKCWQRYGKTRPLIHC